MMNNKLFHVVLFAAGAAVGSVVTWKLVKTKYEQLAQEEIDSVKEAFARINQNEDDTCDDCEEESSDSVSHSAKPSPGAKPSLAEYAKRLNDEGYTDYSTTKTEQKGGSAMPSEHYVIPPDEYGDEADYALVELRYFEDGVLTDSWYNVITDEEAEDMIGLDSLKHFGEYEEDSVHVRNDRLKVDYEILADAKKYSDISSDPTLVDE